MGKKFLSFLAVIFFAAVFFFSPTSSFAQATASSQQTTQTQAANNYLFPKVDPGVEQNQSTFVQAIFLESMAGVICQLDGVDPTNPTHGCLTINPQTHAFTYSPLPQNGKVGGLIGFSTVAMGGLYTPPASSGEYFRDLAYNFGIAKPAEASGFDQLVPLLNMWKLSRNIAYLFLVIVFIILGVMIMLRVKVNPRTVMTVQNQIPRIIIGILLITFSYAIAGLLVDAMWVTTYFAINELSNIPHGSVGGGAATASILNHPLSWFNDVLSNAPVPPGASRAPYDCGTINLPGGSIPVKGIACLTGKIGDSFTTLLSNLISQVTGFDNNNKCSFTDPTSWVTGCLYNFVFWLIHFIINLIILITIVILLYRVWFMLLKAYILILIYVATGPLWIIAGMLPGSTFGFIPWIKRLLAHLLVFPGVVALIIFGLDIASSFSQQTGGTNGLFIPPLIGNVASNTSPVGNIGWMIALGVLLLAPEVLQMLKDAFGLKRNPYTPAIALGLAAGANPLNAGANAGWSRLMRPEDQMHNAGAARRMLLTAAKPSTTDNRFQKVARGVLKTVIVPNKWETGSKTIQPQQPVQGQGGGTP